MRIFLGLMILLKNIKNVFYIFLILQIEINNLNKSKKVKDLIDSNKNNNLLFNEGNYKLDENISSFKDTNNSTNPNIIQNESKNSFSNNLINTNIPSKNYNFIPNLHSKNYSDNLSKNKTLEEENIELLQENKILKKK